MRAKKKTNEEWAALKKPDQQKRFQDGNLVSLAEAAVDATPRPDFARLGVVQEMRDIFDAGGSLNDQQVARLEALLA